MSPMLVQIYTNDLESEIVVCASVAILINLLQQIKRLYLNELQPKNETIVHKK